jgi:hypothetical protein
MQYLQQKLKIINKLDGISPTLDINGTIQRKSVLDYDLGWQFK